MKKRKNQRGLAMIELAIVLPVIILLFFGGFELTRALRSLSHMSTVVREVGMSAFRLCQKSPSAGAMQSCLDNKFKETGDALSAALGATATYHVSAYRYIPTEPVPSRKQFWYGMGSGSSRFNVSKVRSSVTALDEDNPIVIIAEVFYNFQPMTFFPGADFSSLVLYESAIL